MGGKPRKSLCAWCGANPAKTKYCSMPCYRAHRHQKPISKTCKWCKKPMQYRDGERTSEFKERSCCGIICANKLTGYKQRISLPDSKPCGACGTPFSRKAHESRSNYNARKSCSAKCGGELKSINSGVVKPVPDYKLCKNCGDKFYQNPRESNVKYRYRRCCSKKCSNSRETANFATYDIHGVSMTAGEIAKLAGIGKSGVHARMRRGQDLLTGKKK